MTGPPSRSPGCRKSPLSELSARERREPRGSWRSSAVRATLRSRRCSARHGRRDPASPKVESRPTPRPAAGRDLLLPGVPAKRYPVHPREAHAATRWPTTRSTSPGIPIGYEPITDVPLRPASGSPFLADHARRHPAGSPRVRRPRALRNLPGDPGPAAPGRRRRHASRSTAWRSCAQRRREPRCEREARSSYRVTALRDATSAAPTEGSGSAGGRSSTSTASCS